MESEAGPQAEPPIVPAAPAKRSWGKIVAIAVVVIVIIAAIAYFVWPRNQAPTISQVTVSSESADTGTTLTFTGQASDPDGDSVSYAWNFGDGATGANSSATHAYTIPGRFIGLLTVRDGKGGESTNDGKLLFIQVKLPATAIAAPDACPGPTCAPGPVVAVLSADQTTTLTGTEVAFNGNSSWAYAFSWNNATNPSLGGKYAPKAAWDTNVGGDKLFTSFRYEWGDGSADATGNSTQVGNVKHAFNAPGIYTVRLTVTYTNSTLTPSTKTATAGYAVRVAPAPPPVQVKYKDIFTRVTFGEPQYLDPAVDYETAGGEVLQNTYESLIWYQQGSESVTTLLPRLATAVPTVANGGISADGKNYTFNLRANVQFHSGGTMSADDVVYSIQRVLAIHDPDGPSWILEQVMTNYVSYYIDSCGPTSNLPCSVGTDWVDSEFASRADVPPNIRAVIGPEVTWDGEILTTSLAWAISNSTVERVDADTVVFHLTRPAPSFLQQMAFTVGSVASKACVLAHGGLQWGTHNQDLDRGTDCGTGPFKTRVWELNQVIILDRFDQYWQTPAALKEVHITKATDTSTRELMLLSGDADEATINRDHQYDVMNTDGSAKYPTLRIVKDRPTFNVLFFGYNQNIRGTPPDPLQVPTNFFADVHVRKAFSYSFDYGSFIQNVIFNGGVQLRGPVPEGMLGYNASIPLFSYDLNRAAAELQQTPYWQNGFSITLYYNAGNTVRERGCLLLKQGLEALHTQKGSPGAISVTVRALDWPVYLAALQAQALPIFFLGWAPDYADPEDYVVPFLRSTGTFPIRVGYSNATLDGLIDAAGGELDSAVRSQMYQDLSADAVLNDVPYLWIYQATNFHVERAWVNGYYFNPMLSFLDYYPISKG